MRSIFPWAGVGLGWTCDEGVDAELQVSLVLKEAQVTVDTLRPIHDYKLSNEQVLHAGSEICQESLV